ncbi:MAG: hypothetical protein ACKOGE_05970, partial [Actinomycetota bacterium]
MSATRCGFPAAPFSATRAASRVTLPLLSANATTEMWFRRDLRVDDHPALEARAEEPQAHRRAVVRGTEQRRVGHPQGHHLT